MTSPIDIRPCDLEIVQTILRNTLPKDARVWVFGSRATWTTKNSSDLDLAIDAGRPLTRQESNNLSDDFDESNLPYKVDMVDMQTVSEGFKKIIERDMVELERFQKKATQTYKFKDLVLLTKDGEWGKEASYEETNVPMYIIRGTDFQSVRYGDLTNVPVRYIANKKAQLKGLKKDDIIIETAGGTRNQPTGRTVLLKRSTISKAKYQITCASFSRFLRFDRSITDPHYMYWWLQCAYRNGILEEFHVQHTGVARFQYTDFSSKTLVELPSLSEQKAIAEVLGALDDKIGLNRQMNQTLEAMAQALFKDWFVDFGPTRAKMAGKPAYLPQDIWDLFPDKLDDEGKPEGWKMVELEELVSINPSESLKKGELAPYLEMSSLPTYGSTTTPPVDRAFTPGTKFRNGDTILARITPCLENGKTAFVQCLDEGEVGWGSTEFIILRSKPPVPLQFTYLLARDLTFRNYVIQNMTGTSGRQRAQNKDISVYTFIMPNTLVWETFGSLVQPYFLHIQSNAEKSRALEYLRAFLVPKLLSKEIELKCQSQ